MPGNDVVINRALEYYVGDSQMEELLTCLNNSGVKQRAETDAESKKEQPE
jgi:hypothetical protein